VAIDWSALVQEALGNFTIAALPPNINLPTLPVAVTQVLARAKDPNSQLEDLATIIETDTGLTLELLKHVNSACLGRRVRARSVRQGLATLGLTGGRKLMITVGTKAAGQARHSRLINQACFWNCCPINCGNAITVWSNSTCWNRGGLPSI